MILVIVRIDDILDRLIRDALHLVYDALMIPVEFVVDQDDPLVGDVHSDVASVTFNLVKVILHFVECEFRGRLALGVSNPGQRQK